MAARDREGVGKRQFSAVVPAKAGTQYSAAYREHTAYWVPGLADARPGRRRVTGHNAPQSAATATPPWAFDQPAGSCMNFSTSASIFGSNRSLTLATASTSHQVVR